MVRMIGFSASGRRCGQSHHAAKLLDDEVELMRELHEMHPRGHPEHWGYSKLAEKFEVSKATVAAICSYRSRIEASTYRTVSVTR